MSEKTALEKAAEFSGKWDVQLCQTCCLIPKEFCMSFWCPCCIAIHQRHRLLNGDWTKYECCGGLWCAPCCCKCWSKCDCFGMCLETWCCFWCAIGANRYLVQSTYQVRNTALDNCLIIFMCVCSWVICILRCFLDFPLEADVLIECIYCMFQACLQSQQEHELDVRGHYMEGSFTQREEVVYHHKHNKHLNKKGGSAEATAGMEEATV